MRKIWNHKNILPPSALLDLSACGQPDVTQEYCSLFIFIVCMHVKRVWCGDRKRALRSISGGTSSFFKTNQPCMEIKIDFLLNRMLPTLTLRQQLCLRKDWELSMSIKFKIFRSIRCLFQKKHVIDFSIKLRTYWICNTLAVKITVFNTFCVGWLPVEKFIMVSIPNIPSAIIFDMLHRSKKITALKQEKISRQTAFLGA